jgi:Zn/Cd-binding protein ZinT
VNPLLEKLFFCAFRPESINNFIEEFTLESVVNIGTNARPQTMTIEAVRDYSLEFADHILAKIKINKEQLEF